MDGEFSIASFYCFSHVIEDVRIKDEIKSFCISNKILVYRGHHTNLLNRYYNCAKYFKAKNIVRITSDCPLIDFKIIDQVIKKYFENKDIDYMSNTHPPTFPDGFDIEVFKFQKGIGCVF